MTESQKRCSACGFDLAVEMFSRRLASPDGLQAHCKPCMANYQAERQERRREERDVRLRAVQREQELARRELVRQRLLKRYPPPAEATA